MVSLKDIPEGVNFKELTNKMVYMLKIPFTFQGKVFSKEDIEKLHSNATDNDDKFKLALKEYNKNR